jgi:hypothetical protein
MMHSIPPSQAFIETRFTAFRSAPSARIAPAATGRARSPRLGTARVVFLFLCATSVGARAEDPVPLDKILDRTSQRVSEFVDQFSNVKCIEQVTQQKFRPDGKVELEQQSAFDYLVILTNSDGDINVNESRLPLKEAKINRRRDVSMLLSNGFATLFLVFHPAYINNFEFTDAAGDTIDGRPARKVHFEHIRNTRSIAALALRGREYPLELSGTVWIDASGNVMRIEAGIASTLEDVGMKTLTSEVRFSPVAFGSEQSAFWFPAEAIVEVDTPKQHWRNTHRFSAYKQFSVTTEEHVANK